MAMRDLKPEKANLARAGKIRLGIKVKNKDGVEYPKETEYFVLNDVPELAEHFRETIGTDKPTELPIFFPFDDIDSCLDGWHKLHMASSMWCRGDGKNIIYAVDTQTGKRVINDGVTIRPFDLDGKNFQPGETVRCPGYDKVDAWTRCNFCKPHTTITFMIRGLPVEKLEMAMYHIETPSVNNYPRLYEQLMGIRRLAKMLKGREYLAGIPVVLRRVKEQMGAPNLDKNGRRKKQNGKQLPSRMRVAHYLLEFSVEKWWVQQAIEEQTQFAAPSSGPLLAETIPLQTTDIIEGDFYNEDYHTFKTKIIKHLPYFANDDQIAAAITDLELIYDPENEEMLLDALAKYADAKADETAAKQEEVLL